MKSDKLRDFDKEAAQWDENPLRVKLANDVAASIIREAAPSRDMDVLDFGCGTGLVTLRLQPLVRTITCADSSQGMLNVLEEKIKTQGIPNIKTQFVDFEKGGHIVGKFHLVVSSMTLHHVPDTALVLRQWRDLLLPGGILCFADLDAEDGSFHPDNTGVFHFGFDRGKLKDLLGNIGFSHVRDTAAATIFREIEGKEKREFPVFLIIGKR